MEGCFGMLSWPGQPARRGRPGDKFGNAYESGPGGTERRILQNPDNRMARRLALSTRFAARLAAGRHLATVKKLDDSPVDDTVDLGG